MMTEKELTEKIEKFVKDDSKFELQLSTRTRDKKLFIKHKLGNNVLLYGKDDLESNISYFINEKYNYCGFYNLTQNKLFDLQYPLTLFVDKRPLGKKGLEDELYKKIMDSLANEIIENSTMFEGMKLSNEDEDIEDIIYGINRDIFNDEKCKALKDVIYVNFGSRYFKGEEEIKRIDNIETIFEYLDNPDEVVNRYKNEILQKRKNSLFNQRERYKIYSQKFKEIMNDKSNIIHKQKALKDAIKDMNMKSIKITIMKKGKTFTFKADTEDFKYYHSNNEYSCYHLSKKECEAYTQLFGHVFGHEDYTFDEIQKITYGKEELYVKD